MRSIRQLMVAAFGLLGVAAPVIGQAPGSGSVLHVSPYVGYMVFGNFLNGPLGTSLSNAPGLLYGTQVGLSLAPNLSLVGNLGYTASDVCVGVPILGGITVGHSNLLVYDADLEYGFGTPRAGALPIAPFVQAGIGAMRYDIAASILNTQATNLAANVGVGADLTVGKGMALRVLAKDYIGKFNVQDAVGFGGSGATAHNIGLTVGMRFDF